MLCCLSLDKIWLEGCCSLERDQLTSGTTWHAAGLVSQLGPTATIQKFENIV